MGASQQECMLYVAWSGLNDPDDTGHGHHLRRGEVTADLGFDGVPSPPFTPEEMQQIMFAAKMQALRCLGERKQARPSLNGGTKDHPLSQYAREMLRSIASTPCPRQSVNPGAVDRLLRGGFVEVVQLPRTYKSGRRIVPHLQITKAGRQAVNDSRGG